MRPAARPTLRAATAGRRGRHRKTGGRPQRGRAAQHHGPAQACPPSCTVLVIEGTSLHQCGTNHCPASGSQYVVVQVQQACRPQRLPGPSGPDDVALRAAAGYSFFSRRMPSIIGCQPKTSVTMKPSMRMSVGLLSLMVDL